MTKVMAKTGLDQILLRIKNFIFFLCSNTNKMHGSKIVFMHKNFLRVSATLVAMLAE